jgi:hypothetical protein
MKYHKMLYTLRNKNLYCVTLYVTMKKYTFFSHIIQFQVVCVLSSTEGKVKMN